MIRRPKFFDLLVFFGCCAMLSFFVWHGLYGPRSYENHQKLLSSLSLKMQELETVKAARLVVEDRVKLMRPESLDPDRASQLVREQLGYSKINAIIVKLH